MGFRGPTLQIFVYVIPNLWEHSLDSKSLGLIPMFLFTKFGNACYIINNIWKIMKFYLMKIQIPDSEIFPSINVIRNCVGPLMWGCDV